MASLSTLLPSQEEAALAKLSSRELAAYVETRASTQRVAITGKDGELHQVEVPVSALRLLVDILTELGEGNTVKLIPIHAEMTTQEAADVLNMSHQGIRRRKNRLSPRWKSTEAKIHRCDGL